MGYFSNQLLVGARNCVINCGGVESGMNVLILSLVGDKSNPAEDQAVHALATVCQEVGAHPQILWATGMEKGWWDEPSPIVVGAFRSADVVINNTISIGRPLKVIRESMFKSGVTMIRNMATTADVLASEWATFPFQLSDEITHRIGARIEAGERWRVTHPNGTDVQGRIAAPPTVGTGVRHYGEYRRESRNRPFPQGCFNPMSTTEAEGVLIFDRTLPWEARHIGVGELKFTEPIHVTIQDNKMVHFEGGPEATAYRRFYEELLPYLGEDAWNVSGWHAGVHPKARIQIMAQENPDFWHRAVHNNTSVVHFHLGGRIDKEYNYAYMWHLSNELDGATVYIDGEKLYDAGHLTVLDEPSFRSFAAQFGDVDDLCREVEFLHA